MTSVDDILECLSQNEEQALNRLFEVLRIPSISTMPQHSSDCRQAAEWFRAAFSELGFDASVCDTPGQPALVASYRRPEGRCPHLIYYGHYDVQPPDPLGEWKSGPFEPILREGANGKQVVARGAADDKGQVVAWMESFRAHIQVTGSLPVNITVIIEGEEETGSLNFDHIIETYRQEFDADAAVISDGVMWDIETAAITTQLRGLVYLEISLSTADQDLHSGLYGGLAPNAAILLCALLAELKHPDGRIAIPEIYENLKDPPGEIIRAWQELDFDEVRFLRNVGVNAAVGESAYSALERIWSRPTADINGIWSGFTGDGAKTVIPRRATAKISFRLVPDQDPSKVVEGFKRFVRERLPHFAEATIDVIEAAPAVELPVDNRWLTAAQAALTDEFGKPPLLIGCGGSLGAAESFKRLLGIPTLLFSFGLDDDRVHAPNEKFDLTCFRRCARTHARLLARCSNTDKKAGD